MRDTKFLRSDELPERAALGYLAENGLRTNIFHLAVRGSGDGGIYSTAADIRSLWTALFAGRIVSTDRASEMVRAHSEVPSQSGRYGLGFWLHESGDVVELHGYDPGVSFFGRPVDEAVEIGYSVCLPWRRTGIATDSSAA